MTYPRFNEVTWKTICGFATKWFCLEVCVCEIEDKVGIHPSNECYNLVHVCLLLGAFWSSGVLRHTCGHLLDKRLLKLLFLNAS